MAADFGKNGIGQMGITQLLEALKHNETLETLVIDTNSIGDDGAEAVAQYMAGRVHHLGFTHPAPPETPVSFIIPLVHRLATVALVLYALPV